MSILLQPSRPSLCVNGDIFVYVDKSYDHICEKYARAYCDIENCKHSDKISKTFIVDVLTNGQCVSCYFCKHHFNELGLY